MTAVANNVPPPIGDPIAQQPRRQGDPLAGLLTKPWADWFRNLININERSPARIAQVWLEDQTSISTTDLTDGTTSEGLYRINYIIICTQTLGGFLGTADLQIHWTYRAITMTEAATPLDMDVQGNFQKGSFVIPMDALATITYEVANPSDGLFDLVLVVEEVNA